MTAFLRRFSQVLRVRAGFGLLSLAVCAIGLTSGWALMPHASTMAFAIGGVACLVGAVGLVGGWLVSLSIKAPVDDTAQAVMRIAAGDLETKIESPGRDEISWLRHELNTMRKKLRGAVVAVNRSVQGVEVAAREIAKGNSDLSARTENQVCALQQTASSMSELADSVRSSAGHARGASIEITQARGVAERAGGMMRDVVARMADIQVSARRISEIIGVIDGIAFQTNILALNAAVEAARAGHQGRGFAVVASEVRSLAQRCADAAREVKALIVDSSTKVDAGSTLVGDAGRTMDELLQRVLGAAKLVDDMAQTSSGQSSDIDQVNQSVRQMDSVTQQNAALVEQVAATALTLDEQARSLAQAVSVFSVKA
ncbi:MAG TPA: methyl-accepting chemotaxis protein [Burkholderiaceae bacterium]|nr:methyl-accepting chemotaxis protein [Burkholderiaceae bacterium]